MAATIVGWTTLFIALLGVAVAVGHLLSNDPYDRHIATGFFCGLAIAVAAVTSITILSWS